MSAQVSPTTATPTAPRFALSHFDKMVLLVVALLLAAIGLTVVLGDKVGVTLVRVSPLGAARSTSPVSIQFSETMSRDSVSPRLRLVQVKPETLNGDFNEADVLATVPGDLKWNGPTATLRPAHPLQPGAAYRVVLASGAASETGRSLLAEYRFSFTVRSPRVAYLAPADGRSSMNIWVVDPTDPKSANQVTFSPSKIFDFDVSPDGTQIAFAETKSDTNTNDIKLLNLETGAIQQLTNCQDADCTTPEWRPDGGVIAYERAEMNTAMGAVGPGPTRIWLLDLGTNPVTTRPLFSDSQMLGYGLQWSADGSRATVYDVNSQGILLYDFRTSQTSLIASRYGNTGILSPDGTRVVYPETQLAAGQATSYLQIVDTTTKEIRRLSRSDDAADDDIAAWSPDGKQLAIGRRESGHLGAPSKQIYLMNPDDGSVQPLIDDPNYYSGYFAWDATGEQLVVQRLAVGSGSENEPNLPGIWTVDLRTKALTQVATNGFHPRWVP
jgi:Tol biopolymer transport system component